MLEGHAFIVEAAVSIGGKLLKPGINVYRFANRIPLLFEVSALATSSACFVRDANFYTLYSSGESATCRAANAAAMACMFLLKQFVPILLSDWSNL